jgi:hypothetical protein
MPDQESTPADDDIAPAIDWLSAANQALTEQVIQAVQDAKVLQLNCVDVVTALRRPGQPEDRRTVVLATQSLAAKATEMAVALRAARQGWLSGEPCALATEPAAGSEQTSMTSTKDYQ